MSTALRREGTAESTETSPLAGWALLAGGAFFFAGGSMHPGEDPPGLSVKEHLHLLFSDPAWYPSHALLLVGMALIAAALVTLKRHGALSATPRAHTVGTIAAGAAVLATAAMFLHLIAASEADKIAGGHGTPLTDVHVLTETLTVPAFGFSVAALALVGAMTGAVGNRVVAALGVIGGVAYGLAGATFLFSDRLNFLFPFAAGIGLWAVAAGVGLVRRPAATRPLAQAA